MNAPERYPPPDFSCPPPSSMQRPPQQQQQPHASNFHPGMWSWGETATEPGWRSGEAGYSFPPARGATHSPNFGPGWYRGGPPGGGHNYRAPYKRRRKHKINKQPEYSHHCDTCDRGFKDQQKYDEHVSQHVTCSEPDCNFMAHEKLVTIHWKNIHAPGAKRIKLDTPDEIAKWREERRKNYPTLHNIEKKTKVTEVREQTGGVLETAQFGRMRGRGRGRGRGSRGFRGRHPQVSNSDDHSAISTPKLASCPSGREDPLGVLASSDHAEDSDKEDPSRGLVVAPKQMSSALGSLLANYGSMSESDEEPEAAPILRAEELVQENRTILNGVQPSSRTGEPSRDVETSTKVDNGPQPHSGPNVCNNRGANRGRGGRGGRGRRHQDVPQPRRRTLLEMLLAPDIRHERNVLLQCVRFVVRNNFFGLEKKPRHLRGVETPAPGTEDEPKEVSCLSSPVGGEGLPAVPEAENLQVEGTRSADVSRDAGWQRDGVCSGDSFRSVVTVDGTGAGSIQHVGHSHDPSVAPPSNLYDDEIWESNGADS